MFAGIHFLADATAMSKMIQSASQLWVNALKTIADEGVPKEKLNTIKPNMSCSAAAPLYWKDGKNFFQ